MIKQKIPRPEKKLTFVLGVLIAMFVVFSLGFFVCYVIINYSSGSLEKPFASTSSSEFPAPSDSISESRIFVYPDKVIIEIENASLSSYASTGSMLPFFDAGANGIRIKPSSPDEISPGDIVTYQLENNLIIHRVIEKSSDESGVYFIVKGDNNPSPDGKISFSQIKYKTIGILY